MPRSARGFPVRLGALLLLTALCLAACGEEKPTVSEAGETLKSHVLQLLQNVNAKNIKVTDSGGRDISCGEGKAKRTFAATGQDTAPQTRPTILNTQLLGALNEIADYQVTASGGTALKVSNEPAGTFLELGSKDNGQYAVKGETDCLNQS